MSQVSVQWRGGIGPRTPLEDVQEVSWFYRMDDFGEATVVVSDACCLTRQDISPLANEIQIYNDDGTEEWVGVIVRMTVEDGRLTIEARTLDWWLTRTVSDTGLTLSPGPVYQTAVDLLKTRNKLNVEHDWIKRGDDAPVLMDLEDRMQTYDLMTDMAERGFHWATSGRSIYFGERLNRAPDGVFARIMDTSQFTDPPVWVFSALGYASEVEVITTVEGVGDAPDTTTSKFAGTHADSYFGAATLLQFEGEPRDWLIGRNRPRWSLATFDSGVISPFEILDLWPGLPVLIRGERACESVEEPMIIASIYRDNDVYGLELVSQLPDYGDL